MRTLTHEQEFHLRRNTRMNFFFCGNQKPKKIKVEKHLVVPPKAGPKRHTQFLQIKINYMSTQQADEFIKGLNDLITKFKEDFAASKDVFGQEVKGATKKFVDASHAFAQTSVASVDQLAADITTLYTNIYGEGVEPILPPDTGTGEENPDEGNEGVS